MSENISSSGIKPERLIELADSGYIPHFRIDGGPPMFIIGEVKKWIAENLLGRNDGRKFSDNIRIVVEAPPMTESPPKSICNITQLQQIPHYNYRPGIYFLCDGNDVVYVGQSVNPAARISAHISDRYKKFDRVYLLPVPQSELDDVEAMFINSLKPKLNGWELNGKRYLSAPVQKKTNEEIFEKFEINISIEEEI